MHATLFLSLFLLVHTLVPVAHNQEDNFATKLASAISSGTESEREQAVWQAAKLPREKRPEVLTRALAAELERMNVIVDQRQRSARDGKNDPNAGAIGEYYGLLVQINAEARNPVTIPALVGALGTGNMAVNALAGFGEIVLPAVIPLALVDDDGDTASVSGALMTLSRLVSTKISENGRQQILNVTHNRLQRRQHELIWGWVCELAVATGDNALRAAVEDVAAGLRAADVIGRPESARNVQDRARKILERRRKQ